MDIHLCSEVIRELEFAAQCRFVREAGYDGLEIAPFTLGEDPTALSAAAIGRYRSIATDEGVRIAGLHWLLAEPPGLSITSGDEAVARRTRDAGRRLVELCHGLGGGYLVHGSPGQRLLALGHEAEGTAMGTAFFATMGEEAEAAGLIYFIEPLSRSDTAFVNTIDEALGLIGEIGSNALKTMIDCYAASSNGEDIPALLDRWIPAGIVGHVHFNDRNRRGPGEGDIAFGPIIEALERNAYDGASAVEPFVYLPDGPACAARSIGFLRGLIEGCRRGGR